MKNNKGFTLIEMLGAVTLLGILGTVAIVGTSKYIASSRAKSYKMMSQSLYEAVENCAVEGKCSLPGTFNTSYLIDEGYLDRLKNPINKNNDCTGTILVTNNGASSVSLEYVDYKYKVTLNCPGLEKIKKDYIWPDEKKNK